MSYYNDSFAAESFYDRMRNNYYSQEEDYDPYEREEDIEDDDDYEGEEDDDFLDRVERSKQILERGKEIIQKGNNQLNKTGRAA